MSKVLASHTAGIASTQRQRMEDARGHWKHKALFAASMVTGLIPVVGSAAAGAVDQVRTNSVEEKQLEVLADTYRNQIAARLGIKPESVTVSDLRLAAKVEPKIAQAIKKITDEQRNSTRANVMGTAGMTAVGWIPGVNMVTSSIGRAAIHMGGAMGGQALSSVFNKDILQVQDMMEVIDEKKAQGQPVTASDIVLLRISQDEKWQAEFKKQHSKPFHKLSDEEKAAVAQSMPQMLMGAEKQADAVNRNLVSIQNLVMDGPESTSSFADNARPKAQGSFRDSVNQSRELALQGAAQQGRN